MQRLLQPKTEKDGRPRSHVIPRPTIPFERILHLVCYSFSNSRSRNLSQNGHRSVLPGCKQTRGARIDGQASDSSRRSDEPLQDNLDPYCSLTPGSAAQRLATEAAAQICA